MFWRLSSSQFSRQSKVEHKRGLQALVMSGRVPGILGYIGSEAVVGCSVGPRESFPRIERSRKLKRIDDRPTWSVNCFFVAKPYRQKGLMVPTLKAAVAYARSAGALLIEGYPVEPHGSRMAAAEAYTGVASAFRQAGFVIKRQPVGDQIISRYVLDTDEMQGYEPSQATG